MKCPKCGYLGFEQVERCRNCGYDFSLSPTSTAPDLTLRSSQQETERPIEDFTLLKGAFERGAASPAVPRRPPRAVTVTPELPLFHSNGDDDLPLVGKPSAPRSPLAVRRATPEVPRLRGSARATMFDVAALESDAIPRPVTVPVRPQAEPLAVVQAAVRAAESAGLVARVIGTIIDLAVIAGIDAVVLYFTLRIAWLTLAEFGVLPPIPLAAFLVAQNLSYFVAFTAGGQTLGQMATSIKVISIAEGTSPNLTQAIARSLIWTLLALPAGLGLLTVLFGDDRRGLHDRVAGTRVVRIADA
jgi:uncharacterized RDD family membrane protein YckC